MEEFNIEEYFSSKKDIVKYGEPYDTIIATCNEHEKDCNNHNYDRSLVWFFFDSSKHKKNKQRSESEYATEMLRRKEPLIYVKKEGTKVKIECDFIGLKEYYPFRQPRYDYPIMLSIYQYAILAGGKVFGPLDICNTYYNVYNMRPIDAGRILRLFTQHLPPYPEKIK